MKETDLVWIAMLIFYAMVFFLEGTPMILQWFSGLETFILALLLEGLSKEVFR